MCGLARGYGFWSPSVDAILPIRVFIRFGLEGVALFLCQRGAGTRAVQWALQCAAGWCALLYLMEVLSWWNLGDINDHTAATTRSQIWIMAEESLVMIFYFVMWLFPSRLLYRRPALYPYARGLAIYQVCYCDCCHWVCMTN
jgi:hypothetical protein